MTICSLNFEREDTMRNLLVMLSVMVMTAALHALDVWPQRNFDPARTGRTPGVGEIVTPELKWSYFTGGYASDYNLVFDKNDPVAPFVFTMGGHVIRKNIHDEVLWDTGQMQASRMMGLFDLDHDGSLEVVTHGADTLRVWDPSYGNGLFSYYLHLPVNMAWADLDNDGSWELMLRNKNPIPGYNAYEINPDLTGIVLKWSATTGLPTALRRGVFGDLDNDPTTKELFTDSNHFGRFWILDAKSGLILRDRNIRYTNGSESTGLRLIMNVDDDTQNEVLITGQISFNYDSRSVQISVYDYLLDQMQWYYEFATKTAEAVLDIVPESVADLDGDGAKEIVISVYNNTLELSLVNGVRVDSDRDGINLPNRWVTIILDAATGAVKGYLPDQHLEGVADLDGDGIPEIVLKNAPALTVPAYGAVTAYNFSGGGFAPLWSATNLNLLTCTRPIREDMEDPGLRRSACIKDFDGDGVNELIAMRDSDGDGFANSVAIVQNGTGLTHQVPLALGEEMAFIYGDGTDLVLSRNTGHVFWYKVGSGGLTSHAVVTIGGFYGDAVIFPEKDSPQLVTRDSVKRMLMFDTLTGSPNNAPEVIWSAFNSEHQEPFSFDRDGTGNYGFLRRIRNAAGDPGIELRDGNGILLWQRTLQNVVNLPQNFVSGDFNGDGMVDVAYYVGYIGQKNVIEAVNGNTGAVLFSHDASDINTYNTAMLVTTPDVSGDGIADVFAIHNTPQGELINGMTGERIRLIDVGIHSRNGFSADLDGDGSEELFGNAYYSKKMLNTDNSVLWEFSYGNTSSYYAVLLGAAGLASIDTNPGLDVALGGQYGDLSAYSGLDGTALWKRCLYLGMAIDLPLDAFLTRTDCPGAKLSNIASGDIDGDGLEEFVVGSPDGYLYVVNSEDGTLAWSWLFDYAVGNPILADVDDDGAIEVVVGVADGYLYALDQKRYTESFPVREVEVKSGKITKPGTDIDAQTYAGYIGVAWSPVFKAKGYDVRIVDGAGAPVSDVVTVATGFQAIVTDTDIVSGQTYYAEVRGYDDEGYYSDWSRGDGVTVNVPLMTSLMSKIKNLFK